MDRPPGLPPPVVLAPMYGREHDLSRLLALLRGGVRLLTLRGPGGIGKTALALQLGQVLRDPDESLPFDHVQMIDLSAVRDPERVVGLIAASLPDSGLRGNPERQIQSFASQHRTLLILDNFEQLLPAAAGLADLLAATTTLTLVVTSRSALRLHDEVEYPVEPLGLAQRVRDAASSPAVQLFVARVRAVQPSFELTETITLQVVRLCEVLEGVPLALELAAVRTRSLSLGDLLVRLERPLEVLKADFRDRPERLQSLRAAVQWSYDLLGDADRTVFECCAVFDGPFTPQALADVWDSPDALDRAESLLAQSFLSRLDTPDTLWKMLQPLKELALERLEGHPQVDVWRERHARHFLNMVEENKRSWQTDAEDRVESYLPHYPNIRAGLVWTVNQYRSDLAYRYLSALGVLWWPLGLALQELPLIEQVLALPEPEDRVTLLGALGVGAFSLSSMGQFEAREVRFHRILELCRELNDVESAAEATLGLAGVAREAGQKERAWEITERVIRELNERVGDTLPTLTQLHIQADAHWGGSVDLFELGRQTEALEYARLAARFYQQAGNRGLELVARSIEAYLLVCDHQLAAGRSLLLSCLHDAVRRGFRAVAEECLRWGMTLVAAELRDWTALIQLTGFLNDPSWERSHTVMDYRLRADVVRAREALGEAAYQQAWTTGTQLHLTDMVELAERIAQLPIPPAVQQTHYPDLTPREQEVLALVSQGHPDRKVARLLCISPRTASKHLGNLLSKLGLRNRVELARWAIEHAPPE